MKTKTTIIVRTRFEAIHKWDDAPEEVGFLRYPHRHVFHVEAAFPVKHQNRDREFFTEQARVSRFVHRRLQEGGTTDWSCEMWAASILDSVGAVSVSVWEDGENGAKVERV